MGQFHYGLAINYALCRANNQITIKLKRWE
jgi:hypothetical protein